MSESVTLLQHTVSSTVSIQSLSYAYPVISSNLVCTISGLYTGNFNLPLSQILTCSCFVYFSADDTAQVCKALAKKSHNLWYEARLTSCNHEVYEKAKKVYVYISPKVRNFTTKVIKALALFVHSPIHLLTPSCGNCLSINGINTMQAQLHSFRSPKPGLLNFPNSVSLCGYHSLLGIFIYDMTIS